MSVEQAMLTTTTTSAPVTVEQLWEMPETPGMLKELVRGEIIRLPLPTITHNAIAYLLERLLELFVSERSIGVVCPAHTSYVLSHCPDTLRIPDISFVSGGPVPTKGVSARCWFIAPDLAVEVVSSSDLAYDLHDRVGEYFAAGTRLVWVLWPKTRTVSVYADRQVGRELRSDDTLYGGDVLSGFSVRVATLFDLAGTW